MESSTLLIRQMLDCLIVYDLINGLANFCTCCFGTTFQFFEMPRHEALKALDVYRRVGQLVLYCLHYCHQNQMCFDVLQVFLSSRRIYSVTCCSIIFLILQAGSLSDFYEVCRGLELARKFQFLNLREVNVLMLIFLSISYISEIDYKFFGLFCSLHNHFLQPWKSM